jgi:hypothetical protein
LPFTFLKIRVKIFFSPYFKAVLHSNKNSKCCGDGQVLLGARRDVLNLLRLYAAP